MPREQAESSYEVTILKEPRSGLSMLVCQGNNPGIWLPRSQISHIRRYAKSDDAVITIPDWLAEEKGLKESRETKQEIKPCECGHLKSFHGGGTEACANVDSSTGMLCLCMKYKPQ